MYELLKKKLAVERKEKNIRADFEFSDDSVYRMEDVTSDELTHREAGINSMKTHQFCSNYY